MALKRNVKEALDIAYVEACRIICDQDNLRNLESVNIYIGKDSSSVDFYFTDKNIENGIEKTEQMLLCVPIRRENF